MEQPHPDNIQIVSDKAAALVALIVNENIPHTQAMMIMMGVIDALARLSGNREVFWSGMSDLITAAAGELGTSKAIH
jgi:NADPH:quinone reductase-like Zn-dependent oxidoreductase